MDANLRDRFHELLGAHFRDETRRAREERDAVWSVLITLLREIEQSKDPKDVEIGADAARRAALDILGRPPLIAVSARR